MRNIQAEINKRQYSDNIPHPRESAKNFFTTDPNLIYHVQRFLPPSMQKWAMEQLTTFGERVAGPIDDRAAYTDAEGKPKLKKYNRLGEDISEIVTNDGYKKTVAEVYGAGIVSHLYHPVEQLGTTVPYMYSFLMGYLLSQSETGFYCPVTLTMSAAYLIDTFGDDHQKKTYLTGLTSTDYETLYEGATWLTERQGGSDVGANRTVAVKVDGEENVYTLTGEKFFASNAGAMVATVLARVDDQKQGTKGLGLFLVPWIKPNGQKNQIYIRRLKEKLGVNAVPSAEVILEGAEGYLIGKAENGFKYMAEALNISRICNAVASVGIMRRALHEAVYYAENRAAFGANITQYPMVREMISSQLRDVEVSTSAVFHMIEYFDKVINGTATLEERVMSRVLIPLIKYRTGEEAVEAAHTAIEIHGGNGYIEEYVTPRLLRDAQVTTVWEGSSNILALDLLRVIEKENGHELFMRTMHVLIDGLTHSLSMPFAVQLRNQLTILNDNLTYLLQQPKDYLTYKLKSIADHMVDIYSLCCIVREAQDQLENDGNARKYVVAELYWKKHFYADANRGIQGDSLLDVQFYSELLNYGHITEEQIQSASIFRNSLEELSDIQS
ncbi:acyl-CoA dehydrogenase family protein [Paenibacillus sediminis]|uniref:Alkylation response protein AidB-like acyl-CoA dehydrogenase n=1 Tax=Paenibacillus sediminis TaxID=664909 RepID=A0ABS4H0S2_9BACL|nr:acyl-CoA dehydrogenase family protein [Paenibacillus sediminis]MBP1936066.1 alkylation response protein AidB-like acyl-CoA dehydrogenase [Paenibacillus sediminis]